MKLSLKIVAIFVLAMVFGCEESGVEVDLSYASENVVCENLYQGESIEEAIAFMGVPEDIREGNIGFIERNGELASGKELEFANRLFKVRRSRSVEDYSSLLSRKMQKVMAANDKESFLVHRIAAIKKGHYLYAECEDDFYGKCDAKFLVTFGEVDMDLFKRAKNLYFPEMPTRRFVFFHFHNPNYMVIGSTHYLVKEDGDCKLIVESLKNMDMPASPEKVRVLPVTVSGIEKKTIYDYSGKSCEQWHVGLTEADNKNNIIEIVKTIQVIKGEKKLEGDQAQEVVIGYDAFEKYAKVWDDVRFKFAAAIERKSERSFGPDIGGFKYILQIASGSVSSDLKYPGMAISNVSIKEEGVFADGELELFSFDSVGADGVVYRNKVFVRLTLKGQQ